MASVWVDKEMAFAYDADGQWTLTTLPEGTKIYTPFPDYELTDPPTGADQIRISYRLAGKVVAIRNNAGAINHVAFDHLGSVGALWASGNTIITNSLSRFDPFGNFRTVPTGTNPSSTNQGFTGHRHNNTGTYDLGLIYMNARYYVPEVGRFASPDTLVPDPGNPQSYNRYSYGYNNPVKYTDPSGHCVNNYEAGSADLTTCLAGWNAVGNYIAEATYNSGGAFPNALYNDWLMNADIATLENLMSVYGIDYGYTFAPPAPATPSGPPGQSIATNTCNYWERCYEPVITGQEMQPDALIIPGASGSAAAAWYITAGGEVIWNIRSGEVSGYSYAGQGIGVAAGGDLSPYFGVIWNLENNAAYAGDSTALIADFAPWIGAQAQLFWETGTVPFTGETWGIAIGPSGGLSFGVSGVQSTYSCQFGNCQ